MSKEQIGFTEHNYDPLNNAIEESIRAQRAKSSWMFAKVFALVLVSIGILAGAVCLAAESTVPSPPRTIANSMEESKPAGTQLEYPNGRTC